MNDPLYFQKVLQKEQMLNLETHFQHKQEWIYHLFEGYNLSGLPFAINQHD